MGNEEMWCDQALFSAAHERSRRSVNIRHALLQSPLASHGINSGGMAWTDQRNGYMMVYNVIWRFTICGRISRGLCRALILE